MAQHSASSPIAKYFATVARDLESLAAQELTSLGAEQVQPGFCGVAFEGDRELLYRVNLWARLPFRILQQLDVFPCGNADDLYRGIKGIDWQRYLDPGCTLAVTATGKNSELNHSHFTALQVKNAIVDQQQEQWGERSNVDIDQPDVRINIHIRHQQCTVSLDSSGDSLHRRGYRPAMGDAPLKESLAAALIQLSGWTPDQAFFDPLCGSGTLPLEASLMALKMAPGLFRDRFGFETWPDFDRELMERLIAEAEAGQLDQPPAYIGGSDGNADILEQARANARDCGVAQQVEFQLKALDAVEAPAQSGLLICNPPYGERIGGSPEELAEFYRLLGNVLKQRFKGWTAFVLSGNKDLARNIRLKSTQRIPVNNGGLSCQLMKYELY
ncbi:MAG: RNA methyltransferase [Synechococcales cyanobacterium RM1_1_8]|nr:RNA methyltransferase [Synechococcales cyanobacterium RM1_1_8]